MGKKVEYTNGELTIVWQPELCQHAGICVKMLPNVYHPKERPWVQIENATTEELIAQIRFFAVPSRNPELETYLLPDEQTVSNGVCGDRRRHFPSV